MRCSSRYHQTRCGMWWTSPCAPVAIDERQTGVSDGNVDAARAYVPCSSRKRIAGVSCGFEHRRRQTVDHDQDDRLRQLIARERAKPGMAVGARRRRRAPSSGHGERLEVAEHGHERERRADERRRGRSARRCHRACRRAEALRRRPAPRRTRRRRRRRRRRRPRPTARTRARSPPLRPQRRSAAGSDGRSAPVAATPSAVPRPTRMPIVYQAPISRTSVGGGVSPAAGRSRRA